MWQKQENILVKEHLKKHKETLQNQNLQRSEKKHLKIKQTLNLQRLEKKLSRAKKKLNIQKNLLQLQILQMVSLYLKQTT